VVFVFESLDACSYVMDSTCLGAVPLRSFIRLLECLFYVIASFVWMSFAPLLHFVRYFVVFGFFLALFGGLFCFQSFGISIV